MQKLNKELEVIQYKIKILENKIIDYECIRKGHWVHSSHRKNQNEYMECIKRQKELLSKIEQYKVYYDIIKNNIILIITHVLTIGYRDNDLKPFTCDQVDSFIKENDDKIETVIENIINDYDADGKLELLKDPPLGLIRKYLFTIIDAMIF
jgi:hypothetical protein